MNTLEHGIKIYLANWVFETKVSLEPVIVKDVVTSMLPHNYLVNDQLSYGRAIRDFGKNSKTLQASLTKEKGVPKVLSIVFTKFIGFSQQIYIIKNGKIHIRPPQENIINVHQQSALQYEDSSTSINQGKDSIETKKQIFTIEKKLSGFDWENDF